MAFSCLILCIFFSSEREQLCLEAKGYSVFFFLQLQDHFHDAHLHWEILKKYQVFDNGWGFGQKKTGQNCQDLAIEGGAFNI